jgi:hypothetical protein
MVRSGLACGQGVGDFGEDGGGFDFDFAFHTEDFEEDFDAFLGGEDLGDEGADAAEGAFQKLHFVADGDGGGDFDGFLVNDGGAEFGDDFIGDDGGDAAEADDGGDAVGGGDMAVVLAEIEFREDIAGEHGFDDLDLAAAAGALEAEHGAEDFDADIAHQHAAGGGFVAGLGFHTEPAEFLVLEMGHGVILAMGGMEASAGRGTLLTLLTLLTGEEWGGCAAGVGRHGGRPSSRFSKGADAPMAGRGKEKRVPEGRDAFHFWWETVGRRISARRVRRRVVR